MCFLRRNISFVLTFIPWVDFLWVVSLVSVSHWWIPLSGEPIYLLFWVFHILISISQIHISSHPPINRVINLGLHTNFISVGISIIIPVSQTSCIPNWQCPWIYRKFISRIHLGILYIKHLVFVLLNKMVLLNVKMGQF